MAKTKVVKSGYMMASDLADHANDTGGEPYARSKYRVPDMVLTGEHGEINLKAWDDAVALYEERAASVDFHVPHSYLYGAYAALSKERTKHLRK